MKIIIPALSILSMTLGATANPVPSPEDISTNAFEVLTISKYGTTTCANGGGPTRKYEVNKCYDYYDSDHGFKLLGMQQGCTGGFSQPFSVKTGPN